MVPDKQGLDLQIAMAENPVSKAVNKAKKAAEVHRYNAHYLHCACQSSTCVAILAGLWRCDPE